MVRRLLVFFIALTSATYTWAGTGPLAQIALKKFPSPAASGLFILDHSCRRALYKNSRPLKLVSATYTAPRVFYNSNYPEGIDWVEIRSGSFFFEWTPNSSGSWWDINKGSPHEIQKLETALIQTRESYFEKFPADFRNALYIAEERILPEQKKFLAVVDYETGKILGFVRVVRDSPDSDFRSRSPVDVTLEYRNIQIPEWEAFRSPPNARGSLGNTKMAEVTSFKLNGDTPKEQSGLRLLYYSWLLDVIEKDTSGIEYYIAHTFEKGASKLFSRLGFKRRIHVIGYEYINIGTKQELIEGLKTSIDAEQALQE
jgi:hypothetical protein